jgi:hypothetical protein
MPQKVLELARAVLDGRHAVPSSQLSRMAALLARQALEQAVDVLCGPEMRRATMRSRLLYLRVLVGPQTADRASIAWSGLSQACHQHAYELTPTRGEVDYLMGLVSTVKVEKP